MFNEKEDNENNIKPIEAVEQNSENQIIDFYSYVEVCNYNNDSSRKRGILSSEAYTEIVEDPGTIFIRSGNSKIPVFMNASHGLAMGYDPEKCKKYVEELSGDVKILTLPFHELNDEEKQQVADIIKSGDKFALYFSDHKNDESAALVAIFNETGIEYTEKPLLDSRADKGDEQASLYLYSCRTEQKEEKNRQTKLGLIDVYNYFDKNIGPRVSDDGNTMTNLNMGNRITDIQAEEMWDVYNDRFNFLGENHPISMQDSKEDFFDLLRSENTLISATYDKDEDNVNKLSCFVYFVDDINRLYWLNDKFIADKFNNISGGYEYFTTMFTPGIVSSAVGKSHSFKTLGLFSKACDEAGISASVMYENTNLSKGYIPRIVDLAIGRVCKNMVLRPSKIVDNVNYRLYSL